MGVGVVLGSDCEVCEAADTRKGKRRPWWWCGGWEHLGKSRITEALAAAAEAEVRRRWRHGLTAAASPIVV